MSDLSRPWRPRFRLASLLWLMLCVALTIGTYRWAYERGREDAFSQRTLVGKMYARVYYVQDVISATKTGQGAVLDFDSLLRDLKKDVLPNTWDDKGGGAAIAEFPANISIVVTHDENGHERVAAWLKQREEHLRAPVLPRLGRFPQEHRR